MNWKWNISRRIYRVFAWFKCKDCHGSGGEYTEYDTDCGVEANIYECPNCFGYGRNSKISSLVCDFIYWKGWY
jgi:hypothetical protein